MTSAENSVSEPPNLKIFWERIPPDPTTRLVPSELAIMPPVTKNLATALSIDPIARAPANSNCFSFPFRVRVTRVLQYFQNKPCNYI